MWRALVTFSSMAKSVLTVVVRGWGGDGREKALLEHVIKNAKQGNPESVLQVIDEYARSGTWLMNIGSDKGRILDEAVAHRNPKAVLELGTYCGYSAVRIASNLKEAGSSVISLELDAGIASIAAQIIDQAGLASKVKILRAPLSTRIDEIKDLLSKMEKDSFDFVFIDHDKNSYLTDYLLLKQHNLITSGTVIFADNLGFPGSPKFWSYLKSHTEELDTQYHKSNLEYMNWIPDTVAISTVLS